MKFIFDKKFFDVVPNAYFDVIIAKNIDNTIENDLFIPFGSTEYDNPEVGEVVYASGNEIRARKWTWRQGENGKIDNSV